MANLLGRLERVELRDIWKTEGRDFTPWLAQENHLEILGDTIGLELELEAQEKDVGPFRADILCKNTVDDSWVLIENQIERTDHKHLGQLLTYAAGLDAVTIVWVASKFTEEHRSALDWLNKITDQNFRFFGLEVELWRINDSVPAPKFNIISQPNNWSKTVSNAAKSLSGDITETKNLQLEYWEILKDHIEKNDRSIKPQNPRPLHWYNFSIGKSGMHLSATLNTRENKIALELLLCSRQTAKTYYHALYNQKDEIENELGADLDWREMPENRNSRIILFNDADPTAIKDWPSQHEWYLKSLQKFNAIFRKRIKEIEV